VRQATDENIIQHMRIAGWIHKVINTHSEQVMLFAFSLQQRSRERASMLFYTYVASLIIT